jgi:two-component system CheB/CheR fusion protein
MTAPGHALIEGIDLAIVGVTGPAITVEFFNAAAATLLGLTPADIGRPVREVPLLARVTDLDALCLHVIAGGPAAQREVRDRNGSWFLVRISPYVDDHQSVAGAVLALTNVTALRASIEQAIHEREYTKAIVNTIGHPLVVLGPTLKVQTANRAFYETFRVSRSDTEDVELDVLAGGQWAVPGLRDALEDVVRKDSRLQAFEVEADFPALGRRTMLLNARRLAPTGSTASLILLAIEDVTERRRAEAAVVASEQRARALAADAQAANRGKDEFLATLSHELRTPLTAMLGWTRMLRTGTLGEEATRQALETIERNVRNQAKLIEDLLDVSRIISGQLRLDEQRLELGAVVQAAVETMRPVAQAKAVGVSVDIGMTACEVWGDTGRLQQVVWNLLSNAVRFTPPGGTVAIRLERRATEAAIVVADSGAGISPEFLPRVFDRFSQGDGTPARRTGGLGLGLAIVRHLVELHGGTVHAASDGEQRGATFTVTLPRMPKRSPTPGEPPPRKEAEASADVPRLDDVRVLLVEDDADIRELLHAVFAGSHADVRVASGAVEALDLFQSWGPHAVVADIGLPGEDGFVFIEKLRALCAKESIHVPAVALTAYARPEDRDRALSAGYDAYLAKPVEPSSVVSLVHRLTHLG